jgi:hypothetical protein
VDPDTDPEEKACTKVFKNSTGNFFYLNVTLEIV